MSDPIIASVLAKAALDTNGNIDGVADMGGDGTDGLPADPVMASSDEADDRADAKTDADPANDDPDDEDDDADEAVADDDTDEETDSGEDDSDESADTPAEADHEADDEDPAIALVASFPVNADAEQDVEVVEVTEAASCPALPSKATSTKEDRRLVELRGKGFTDEQLRAVGAVLTTASRRQRKLPVHAAVCSAVMQAYWAGRDRERREADCLKAVRNDGGQLGPVRYYESIIRKHDPLAAAKLLAEHHADRIRAIRYIVGATFNESRREDAIAKDVDPTTVKYLAVRTK